MRGTVAVFGEVKGQKQAEAAVCPGYQCTKTLTTLTTNIGVGVWMQNYGDISKILRGVDA